MTSMRCFSVRTFQLAALAAILQASAPCFASDSTARPEAEPTPAVMQFGRRLAAPPTLEPPARALTAGTPAADAPVRETRGPAYAVRCNLTTSCT